MEKHKIITSTIFVDSTEMGLMSPELYHCVVSDLTRELCGAMVKEKDLCSITRTLVPQFREEYELSVVAINFADYQKLRTRIIENDFVYTDENGNVMSLRDLL